MKLPRWLVFAMLFSSLLSVLAAAGWWWVTWPERTWRDFKSLIADGKYDEVDAMLTSPNDGIGFKSEIRGFDMKGYLADEYVRRKTPSILDYALGRRTYVTSSENFAFTVERSNIRPTNWYDEPYQLTLW
jgi:hypothetical protein